MFSFTINIAGNPESHREKQLEKQIGLGTIYSNVVSLKVKEMVGVGAGAGEYNVSFSPNFEFSSLN